MGNICPSTKRGTAAITETYRLLESNSFFVQFLELEMLQM